MAATATICRPALVLVPRTNALQFPEVFAVLRSLLQCIHPASPFDSLLLLATMATSAQNLREPNQERGPEMTILDALGVLVIVVLGAVTIVTFIATIAATVLVTGSVHFEERRRALTGPAPGRCTRLTRALLAVPDG